MKIVTHKKIYFVLALSAMLLPYSVFASNVYIDTDHSDFFVGDTIMFSVRVDSENMNINAVEGSVLLDYSAELASLVDINTSGSTFSLWPGKPLPSESNTSISFAGGSPNGLNSKDATVFNIVLKLQQAGQITLAPKNISVYLNDGKGTKDKVSVNNVVIDVLPKKSDAQSVDDQSSAISNDKTPPEPFEIYLGQEASVFEGKKFLSFVTTDEQSAIAYYEVKENNLPAVQSGNTYVLQEQNEPVRVVVTAYDLAGNTRDSVYTSPSSNYAVYVVSSVIAVVIFMILLVVIVRKMRKAKK